MAVDAVDWRDGTPANFQLNEKLISLWALISILMTPRYIFRYWEKPKWAFAICCCWASGDGDDDDDDDDGDDDDIWWWFRWWWWWRVWRWWWWWRVWWRWLEMDALHVQVVCFYRNHHQFHDGIVIIIITIIIIVLLLVVVLVVIVIIIDRCQPNPSLWFSSWSKRKNLSFI